MLRDWLRPPVFDDDEQTRQAHIVHYFALVLVACLAITELYGERPLETRLALGSELVCVLIILVLNHRGFQRGSVTLLAVSLTALTTFLLFEADGSRDNAMLMYPGTIVLAGLLLERRFIFVVAAASTLGAGTVYYAELHGLLVTPFSARTVSMDFVDVALILAATAIAVALLTTHLRESLQRARESQHSLETGNRELRRQAERLEAAAREWQATFDAVSDAVWILDHDSRIVRANQATETLFGKSAREIAGRLCYEVVHGTAEPLAACPILRMRKTKRRETMELALGARVLLVTVDPLLDEQGELKGAVHLVSDITARKQAEEALRASEERLRQSEKMEAVGQLAGGVAHDLNNQLVPIVGFAEMLASRIEDPRLRQYAEHIVMASNRASDLTRQLLAFARKGRYLSVPINCHELIAEVVALLSHSLDKRILIQQHLRAQPPTILGDPTQLQNALLNLALNARDAMPNGGDLTFATDIVTLDEAACRAHPSGLTPGRYFEIRVTDTGTGMSPATLKHLFEPFFTTKPPGKGTGMGLASVYGALKQHRGGISVSSEPGRGSTFRIHLPLAEADAAPAPAAPPAAPRRAHVMIVEDEPLVRDLAAEAARALGHQVTLCRDGEEAVEVYGRTWSQIDLVVLDVVMPKKARRETFQALRAINPAVRVLVFSGYALDGDAQALLDDGALDFLRKPFSLSEFSRKLSNLLG